VRPKSKAPLGRVEKNGVISSLKVMSGILSILAQTAKVSLAASAVAGAASYAYARLWVKHSALYVGERASLDREIDAELGYPLSALIPLARRFMIHGWIDMQKPGLVDAQRAARHTIALAPHLHLGYSWMALYSARKASEKEEAEQETDKSQEQVEKPVASSSTSPSPTTSSSEEHNVLRVYRYGEHLDPSPSLTPAEEQQLLDRLDADTRYWLNKAHHTLATHPRENEPLRFMLPSVRELLSRSWTPELRECVPDRVWYLRGEFRAQPGKPPLDALCAVLRLEDQSLVLVNPIDFSSAAVRALNRLGRVRAVASPCMAHTDAIERARQHWPDADYYHVKPSELQKHKQPAPPGQRAALTPVHPLEPGTAPFGDEVQLYRLQGQFFAETVFYHVPTRSLLGLTDTVIASTDHLNGAGMGIYALALGMWRGPKHTSLLAVQNYNHFFLSDRPAFRESLRTLLSLDVDRMTLGHGGYLEGAEAKRELERAFAFVLQSDPADDPSLLERICLSVSWFADLELPSSLLRRYLPFASTKWPDPSEIEATHKKSA